MKKTVWVFGLIAGAIAAIFCVTSIAFCYKSENFEGNMLLGYASMLVAFSFVFVGVKNYRDKYAGGTISFLQALKVGGLITLLASTIYVLAWMVDYYLFIPDFLDKFMAHGLQQAKASGASAAAIKAQTEQMAGYIEMYKTPWGIMLATYMEILPVGLVVTLVTALILKRSKPVGQVVAA